MTVGLTASASCSVDTAICMQAAAAKLVSRANLPPPPSHAPRDLPTPTPTPGIWALRHLFAGEVLPPDLGIACVLPALDCTHPSSPYNCCPCPCLSMPMSSCSHFSCDYMLVHTFHGSSCIFTLAPICPCLPHSSLHVHISLICPCQLISIHTCPSLLILVHSSFSKLTPAHSWAYLLTLASLYTHLSIPVSHCPCLPARAMLLHTSSHLPDLL